jgi:2-keto-4-pentenoate hydratase/2-oxohepta-3-ene-1,7-dioic acid hydratase in catechol pathway
MKLYTYQIATKIGPFERIGAEVDGKIVDLNLACTAYLTKTKDPDPYGSAAFYIPPHMIHFFQGGDKSKAMAQESLEFIKDELQKNGKMEGPRNEQILYAFDEVKLMAPVPRPNLVRDCIVFLEHFRERWGKRGWPIPDVFYKYPPYATQSGAIVAGTGDPIWMPRYTKQLDFELELGLYIGKKGIDIREEEAEQYIAGFTVYNDVSARDVQMEEGGMRMGPSKGKNFEHSSIMGPCLVTTDQIDYNNLKMIVRINGNLMAEDNSKDMYHKFPKIISHISQEEYLYPGDFIASGTCPHGTAQDTIKRWLQPGDVLELEIEGIGTIRNEIMMRPG